MGSVLKYSTRSIATLPNRIISRVNYSSLKSQVIICSYSVKLSQFSRNLICKNVLRNITYSPVCQSEEENGEDAEESTETSAKTRPVDPAKDRSKIHSPEISIRYMNSNAYKTTYGDDPVWVPYRRNFKGQFAPKKTREMCIRGGVISTGNPCPICRDEYLVLHYTNVKLLKQFISPYTGKVLTAFETGVCRKQQLRLEVAIKQAKDFGFITFEVPFRFYDYSEFYPSWKQKLKDVKD